MRPTILIVALLLLTAGCVGPTDEGARAPVDGLQPGAGPSASAPDEGGQARWQAGPHGTLRVRESVRACAAYCLILGGYDAEGGHSFPWSARALVTEVVLAWNATHPTNEVLALVVADRDSSVGTSGTSPLALALVPEDGLVGVLQVSVHAGPLVEPGEGINVGAVLDQDVRWRVRLLLPPLGASDGLDAP